MPPSTAPADEWRRVRSAAAPELDALRRTAIGLAPLPLPPQRAFQADAAGLDNELTLLLREQFTRIFSFFHPATVGAYQAELTLLLEFLIYRYSIWEGRPLPGMYLMNLRYRDERAMSGRVGVTGHDGVGGSGLTRTQRGLYCFGAVFLRYLWARAGSAAAGAGWGAAPPADWRSRAWRALRAADTAHRIATALNFLVFLRTGRYRSLLERVVRARAVPARVSAGRAISYEYLNRQLVWAEVSEVLLFLLPLVNAAAVKRAVRGWLPALPALGVGGAIGSGSPVEEGCAICGAAEATTPYAAEPCGHRCCYFCLAGATAADPRFACPRCGERVEAMRPAAARIETKD